jgi:hypothetical protein
MTTGSQQFISDPFTISSKPAIAVGFNCNDAVLLSWNKNKGISKYQVYGLGNKYLEPITIVTDTQFVFNKATLSYRHFAVAPVINGSLGVKSYAIDYSTQGVDCYFKNIIADLVNNTAVIHLSIGTTYLVNKIVFEKIQNGNFTALSEVTNINGLDYSATDINLQKGVNNYRAVIYLSNGKIIYSDLVNLLYFDNKTVLVFPNPVSQNNTLTIKLSALNNQTLVITDAAGRKIVQQKLTTTDYTLPAFFPKGFYIISILNADNTVQFVKLLVQ